MMSSLYIGATGLKSHSEGMAVVTHNLANVNTVAYKQQSMQYSELVSQFVVADSNLMTNMSQKGAGAMPGSIRTLFLQGGHEQASAATDLSIEGLGFFGVTKNGQTMYTRSGNFRFTKDGELLDPSGWNVLGRAFTNGVEATAASPIILDPSNTILPAKATSSLVVCSQLGGVKDKASDPGNPFFSMAAAWDGTQTPPLRSSLYSYSEPITFYDANGDLRTATVYYDLAGKSAGSTAVEYLIGLNPGMDASSRAETESAGLLMAGTITFTSSGQISNLTAFTPPGSGSPAALSGWLPASLSSEGYPLFTAQLAAAGNAKTAPAAQSISLNMGIALTGSSSAGLASAADAYDPAYIDPDTGAIAPGKNPNTRAIYTTNNSAKLNSIASTYYGDTCASITSRQDGYAEGTLRDVNVTADGIIRGTYSNGQTQDLYRISLFRFTSQDGLEHVGKNHYVATPAAGKIEEGIPGTENFGTLSSYSLETSNVDYAREFSTMIITQRGFQMNSKVVTTSDEMLKKALELKR
ncbi:MAG: flagellar hook-basal body complex protein [Clostridia bacterium]|nr:flagellar hook-basal body complex protein [Clostridia bacterium]